MNMSRYVNIHTHRPTGLHIEPSGVGIHPWNADSEDIEQIYPLLESADLIGETGLDFLRGGVAERQYDLFRQHLDIAAERDMPVVLHCVRALEEIMRILDGYRLRAVIFHGFIGSPEQMRRAVDNGYYLSFGERSMRSPKSVEALYEIPLRSLFLETDDSQTTIEEIYEAAAEIRMSTVAELQDAILENYNRIFRKI